MTLAAFEGFGIELELMIVDQSSLDVRPIADRLLAAVGGGFEREVERGACAWSNELQLHVIEMKTNGPSPTLAGVAEHFQDQVAAMEALLEPMGARLLPGGMHPWMDPARELKLWPHEDDVIYRTFDRIFDCTGQGWANLQSLHINLPFSDDVEFARLHAAIRVALPLFPALAAASPFMDGIRGSAMDQRLEVYASNARKVPSVSGQVVPEPVYSRAAYEEVLLGGIYRDLEPHDPEGVLAHEWVNARGAIARFDRMALEIRTLDAQEHPGADLAVATAVVALVRALYEGGLGTLEPETSVERLAALHREAVRAGSEAVLDDRAWLRQLGFERAASGRQLWADLVERLVPEGTERAHLECIVTEGTLAERLVAATGPAPSRRRLDTVYRHLADCLRAGRAFRSEAVCSSS